MQALWVDGVAQVTVDLPGLAPRAHKQTDDWPAVEVDAKPIKGWPRVLHIEHTASTWQQAERYSRGTEGYGTQLLYEYGK